MDSQIILELLIRAGRGEGAAIDLLKLLMKDPGVLDAPGPVLDKSIPFGASPGRSYARAMDFPLSEHAALLDLIMRSDRTSEFPAGMSYRPFDRKGEVAKLTGSMMGYDTQGIYDPENRIISYKAGDRKAGDVYETVAHEFGHPIQRYEDERTKALADMWQRLGGLMGGEVGAQYVNSPSVLWKDVAGKNAGAPGYEDPFAYWMGQQYAGNPVPPDVGQFLAFLMGKK